MRTLPCGISCPIPSKCGQITNRRRSWNGFDAADPELGRPRTTSGAWGTFSIMTWPRECAGLIQARLSPTSLVPHPHQLTGLRPRGREPIRDLPPPLHRGRRLAHPCREPEGRPVAGCALDADFPAHPLDDLRRDGEAQPRAAMLARAGAIRLRERREQPVFFDMRWDTDAGIGDGEAQVSPPARFPIRKSRQPIPHLAR